MTSTNPNQQTLKGIPSKATKPPRRNFKYGLKVLKEIAAILGIKDYK